jgi:transcription elongation factor Elf1
MSFCCPACDSDDAIFLGTLGIRHNLRCRDCGMDFSVEADEDSDEEDFIDDDRFADGDALASAGWGTDEDYGSFMGDD